MKMKDVLEQTDLTDRAVRLYMENGLISPSCNESYAGRKNIEFSEEDVEALKNVATLRKAGFSINEIKLLKQGSVPCRKTIEEFIEKTTAKIESDTAVVEKLEAVVSDEDLSIELICKSLNSDTEEKEIPESDIRLSLAEKIEKYFFILVSIAGFLWLAIALGLQIFILVSSEFRFIVPETEFYIKWATLIYITFVSIFLLNKYKNKKNSTPSKRRAVISIILCTLLIPVGFTSYVYNFLSLIDIDIRSETHSLKNYLVIDDSIEKFSDDIIEFFPEELSTDENTTKYFYRYQKVIDNDRDLTVYLQRDLEGKELEAEIEKYKSLEPLGSSSVITRHIKNWTLLYYCEKGESPDDFYGGYMYKIFAYNKYGTVRYILAYNEGSPVGMYTVPYHMDLTW